jgi:hypothetical protein
LFVRLFVWLPFPVIGGGSTRNPETITQLNVIAMSISDCWWEEETETEQDTKQELDYSSSFSSNGIMCETPARIGRLPIGFCPSAQEQMEADEFVWQQTQQSLAQYANDLDWFELACSEQLDDDWL